MLQLYKESKKEKDSDLDRQKFCNFGQMII